MKQGIVRTISISNLVVPTTKETLECVGLTLLICHLCFYAQTAPSYALVRLDTVDYFLMSNYKVLVLIPLTLPSNILYHKSKFCDKAKIMSARTPFCGCGCVH